MKETDRHLREQLADIQRLVANGSPERLLRPRLEALLQRELHDLETRISMLHQIVRLLKDLHEQTTSAPPGRGRSARHVALIAAFRHPRHPGRSGHAGSESPFREIVEQAPEGIFIQSDTRFRYLNATALRLFGALSAEQLVGQPVADRLHPNSHASVAERLRLPDETAGVARSSAEKFLRLDGTHFDVECSVSPIVHEGQPGAIVFFRDITQRKHADEAERRGRALLKAIVEGTTDAIYVKDRECRLLLVNSAACRMVGKTAGEMIGFDDTALFAPETAKAGMESDRALMAARKTETHEEELTLITGERVTILTTSGPRERRRDQKGG